MAAGKVAFLGDQTWPHFSDMAVTIPSIPGIHHHVNPMLLQSHHLAGTVHAPEVAPVGCVAIHVTNCVAEYGVLWALLRTLVSSTSGTLLLVVPMGS